MKGTEFDIGAQIIEMAERVQVMTKFAPGSEAKWGFTMDGVPFTVAVSLSKEGIPHD